MDKPTQEKVAALLFQWEELKQSGEPVTPESLCPDSPEMLEELKRQIKVLSRVNELLNLVPKETPGGRDLETQFDKQALGKRDASSTQKSSAVADFPRIANYQIVEEIGHGGMGVVFKAYDPELDWLVAIKRLNRSESSKNQHYVERFKREGKVLAKLNHDNIVKIHLAGMHDGQHYFVMRYYPKGPLSKQLKRFTGPADIAKLMAQVARAVHCAHEQNILHRDLKPSNILLDEHDRPIVSDFGLAKTASEVVAEALPNLAEESTIDYQQALTAAGARIGTPPYMAPEQFYVGSITKSSDIWSLGIILYELAVGSRPFQARTMSELAKEVNTGLVAEPRKVNPAIPTSLNNIIVQCLQTDPDLRYKNAALLADDLEATLRGKSRRWVLAAGGLALLGGGVEVGRRIRAKREEDRLDEEFVENTEGIWSRLQKEKQINLINEAGKPILHRWRTPDSDDLASGPIALASRNISLLELFSKLPRYNLSLDIALKFTGRGSSTAASSLGCFYGHSLGKDANSYFTSAQLLMPEANIIKSIKNNMYILEQRGMRLASAQSIDTVSITPIEANVVRFELAMTTNQFWMKYHTTELLLHSVAKDYSAVLRSGDVSPAFKVAIRSLGMNFMTERINPRNGGFGIMVKNASCELQSASISLLSVLP